MSYNTNLLNFALIILIVDSVRHLLFCLVLAPFGQLLLSVLPILKHLNALVKNVFDRPEQANVILERFR